MSRALTPATQQSKLIYIPSYPFKAQSGSSYPLYLQIGGCLLL